MQQVAVIGAGSWGTALAVHLARVGHDVTLWGRDASLVAEMRQRQANPIYLPDIVFPTGLQPTDDSAMALPMASVVVVAVPSHGVRGVARQMAPHVLPGALVVSAVKGIEEHSLLRMTEVLADELPAAGEVAVLSGPSFAVELARGLPTAVVVASASPSTVLQVQAEFRSPFLRLYGTADVIGVEIGGALKNTIAIAAGVVEGLGQGHNALAALITRGLAELTRLAVAMGGAARDAVGAGRTRRPRPDVHRRAQPEPARRRRACARPFAGRGRGQHEDGGRGRADDRGRAGARGAARHRAANHRADGARAVGAEGSAVAHCAS